MFHVTYIIFTKWVSLYHFLVAGNVVTIKSIVSILLFTPTPWFCIYLCHVEHGNLDTTVPIRVSFSVVMVSVTQRGPC